MPDQWRDFAPGVGFPATWTDGIEQLIGNYASPNLVVDSPTTTTVRVAAGSSADTRSLAIQGSPRWITADATASHPGGAAGTHDVWACCTADSFGSGGSPPAETDTTTRAFTLKVTTAGTPSGSGGEALYRKIARVIWDGAAIVAVVPVGLPINYANLAAMVAPYRDVTDQGGSKAGTASAGTYLLGQDTIGAVNTAFAFNPIVVDLTEYAVPGKSTLFRIRSSLMTNAVAPATTLTVGLYPITSRGGASAAAPFVASVGAAVGSSAYVSPLANDWNNRLTGDFALTADAYVLAITLSGSTAINSGFNVRARLQVHNV